MPELLPVRFAAAAALVVGGIAMFAQTNHLRGMRQTRDLQQLEEDLLPGQVKIAEYKAQIKAFGGDPNSVLGAYDAQRDGDIGFDDVRKTLGG